MTADTPLRFVRMALPQEAHLLADWLSGEDWPFHGQDRPSRAKVLAAVEAGHYDGSNHRSFWILGPAQERCGLIRLFDLDDIGDGYPLFDLRLSSQWRGQGLGRQALAWLTRYLFETWPELRRIEGTTRQDNTAMRRVFRHCGYVKEGHYRQSWPGEGTYYDTIHYAILRQDWLSGQSTPVDWDDE